MGVRLHCRGNPRVDGAHDHVVPYRREAPLLSRGGQSSDRARLRVGAQIGQRDADVYMTGHGRFRSGPLAVSSCTIRRAEVTGPRVKERVVVHVEGGGLQAVPRDPCYSFAMDSATVIPMVTPRPRENTPW